MQDRDSELSHLDVFIDTPEAKESVERIVFGFQKLINEIARKPDLSLDYSALGHGELLLRRVLVIFYCQQCVTQMVPALSIDRKQIFRFSQILASFFAGIFEKDDNPNASIQGAETLASLYLLYSADSARQKNSVDSFITGTRWLLRLADQFRLIEKQRIKRQERRQVGSALLALEIERPGADKTILKALSSAGTRLFSKAFRKKLRSRNGSDCQAHL